MLGKASKGSFSSSVPPSPSASPGPRASCSGPGRGTISGKNAGEAMQTNTSDAVIVSRILTDSKNGLSPEVARHILDVGFSDDDKARMHELAVKNQEGSISPKELEELDSYIKAGDLLA